MAEIVGEVVDVVGTWTLRDAHTVVEVFDGVASHATGYRGSVTSLAVQVAINAEALRVRILAERAVGRAE